jgi:transcriptional regulator with XRE-family HTH domain
MIGTMTDKEILRELGRRLREERLRQNLGVVDLAARAGINRNTVVNAERGANPRLGTVVGILRALGRLDTVDAFLPAPALSPLQLARTAGRTRRRARGPSRG